MGLDTTHNCWHGSYSSFGNWRNVLAKAAGYKLTDDPDYGHQYVDLDWSLISDAALMGDWETTPEDPLLVLIAHSDCDGNIHPKDGTHLANRLEQLLPLVGDWDERTEQFITGLRFAADAGEDVEFW